MTKPDTSRLPAPLGEDSFDLLCMGIADDPSISVHINRAGDFAFLDPKPALDYVHYVPRVASLGLQEYKKKSNILGKRAEKIAPFMREAKRFVEIGAADGAFLEILHGMFPGVDYGCIEPDQNSRPARDELKWLKQYQSIAEAVPHRPDLVGMFHVFEHLDQPEDTLSEIKQILAPDGMLLIEVPSLTDPLLSLYNSAAYQAFYFQRQHPYVYSPASLGRVLNRNGFRAERVVHYQRYGMENHLQWLSAQKPGGNPVFHDVFADLDTSYRASLEAKGLTDTFFMIAKLQA